MNLSVMSIACSLLGFFQSAWLELISEAGRIPSSPVSSAWIPPSPDLLRVETLPWRNPHAGVRLTIKTVEAFEIHWEKQCM